MNWIDIRTVMPEEGIEVLTVDTGIICTSRYLPFSYCKDRPSQSFFHVKFDGLNYCHSLSVTHWAPLPELPEEYTNE